MNQEAVEDHLTLLEIRVSSTFALLEQRRAQIHCPGGEGIGSIGAGIFCCPKQIAFLVDVPVQSSQNQSEFRAVMFVGIVFPSASFKSTGIDWHLALEPCHRGYCGYCVPICCVGKD
ncbi:unnamed protein product [Citrullus colocynthis]|uniref:Uncharacterized protein n=1 Tax=Citrullus colocynthis TaxID=252529 RepID=A0ABP0ZBC1_9ROSI